MDDAARARNALEALMAKAEADKGKATAEKALEGPKAAADALKRAMLKEFWQRGKRFC